MGLQPIPPSKTVLSASYVRWAPAPSGGDDSAALIALADTIPAAGGTILLQAGTYTAQGLPIKDGLVWRGLGAPATKIKLPESPTQPMFVAGAVSTLHGGIFDLDLDGNDRATATNGIDLSAATQALEFHIYNCYIQKFDRGYNGSQDDRHVPFIGCRIYLNNVGVWINNNHPTFLTSEFRENDIGLTGKFFDMHVTNCKFAGNRIGVEPQTGTDGGNVMWVNCMFFGNTETGITPGINNVISGCYVVGAGPSYPNNVGIKLREAYVIIRDTLFGFKADSNGEPHDFGLAAIYSTATVSCVSIQGNRFLLRNKPALLWSFGTNIENVTFDNNEIVTAKSKVVHMSGAGNLITSSFDHNKVWVQGGTVAAGQTALFHIEKVSSTSGITMIGNKVRVFDTGVCSVPAIVAQGHASIFKLNMLRGTASPYISLTTTNASTINSENILL